MYAFVSVYACVRERERERGRELLLWFCMVCVCVLLFLLLLFSQIHKVQDLVHDCARAMIRADPRRETPALRNALMQYLAQVRSFNGVPPWRSRHSEAPARYPRNTHARTHIHTHNTHRGSTKAHTKIAAFLETFASAVPVSRSARYRRAVSFVVPAMRAGICLFVSQALSRYRFVSHLILRPHLETVLLNSVFCAIFEHLAHNNTHKHTHTHTHTPARAHTQRHEERVQRGTPSVAAAATLFTRGSSR